MIKFINQHLPHSSFKALMFVTLQASIMEL